MLAAALLLAVPTVSPAQDTTTRGVRIGLTYDPGTKPGIVVLPVSGAGADSINAIVSRDLDYGDRIAVIALDAAAARTATRATGPNWALLAQLGAAAAVQVTPTPRGLHLAVYDVAAKKTALIRDYPAPPMTETRAWRAALHGIADDLEGSITGTRGIARTRVVFERTGRLWVVDSDGQGETPVGSAPTAGSASWRPDGRAITYSTYVPSQVVVQELGGRPRTIAGGSGVYISPIFTPDGGSVMYAHGVDEGVDLYVAPASGGGARRVSVGRGSDNVSPSFSPDGSPDGRLVAFQSRIAGKFQLLPVSLRDRGLKQLTSDGSNDDPSWAPDARHLVFVSNRGGTRQLWVIDVESGRTRQLTRGPSSRLPAWSPRLGG